MSQHEAQRGSALVYILIAIALLGALTATFMDSSSQQTSSQNIYNSVTELHSQANLIRSSIQECVLTYPGGEADLVGSVNTPYPLEPEDAHLDEPSTTGDLVRLLRCPGNPGDSNDHADIFGGTSGKFMPPAPGVFEDWEYYTGPDGVFFWTKTDKTDPFIRTALYKLDDQFSECEADVINASTPATARNMTTEGASGPVCDSKYYCFRVWMIYRPGGVFPGDIDTDTTSKNHEDELDAGCYEAP